jgi:hypothetical protein
MNIKDYIVDTFIINMVILVITVPYYYLTGMPIESLKGIIIAFFTISWFTALPVPTILRKFREKYPYSNEVLING